jgi:hypothetical protein
VATIQLLIFDAGRNDEHLFDDDERAQFRGEPPRRQQVVGDDPSVPASYRSRGRADFDRGRGGGCGGRTYAVAEGCGPPVSFASPAGCAAMAPPRLPKDPQGACGRRLGTRLIRLPPVAAKASPMRSRKPGGSRTITGHITHDAARYGDQMKTHRFHAPRCPFAAGHPLFRRHSLCIILDLLF